MRAFIGFFTIAQRIAVEVFAYGLFALYQFEVGAVKKCDCVNENQSREHHQQNLKQEVGVEPVRAEPDGFDIPPQRAGFVQQTIQLIGR